MRTLVIHPKDKSTDFLKPIYDGRNWTVITGGCTKADVEKAIAEHDHIIMMGHGTPQGLLAVGQFNGKPKPVVKPSTAIRKSGLPVSKDDIGRHYAGGGSYLSDDDEQELDDWFSGRQVGATSYTGGNYPSLSSYAKTYVIDDSTADLLRGKRVTAIWCNADQYMEWNNLSGFYTGMFISEMSEATLIGTADTGQWQIDESNYAFSAAMRGLIDTQNQHEVLKNLRRVYAPLAKRNPVAKYNMLRLFARQAVAQEVKAS